ncbi:Phox4 [Thalictrum thalictroides]|uniref:Phox4 n=1 Tax=Thalictrum thalictroides TaxID=46969 RepID=A0A7J6XC64_THATH|nr:Phox4 [Thalictrum thalictroides]
MVREKTRKKKSNKAVEKKVEDNVMMEDIMDKVVVEENLDKVEEDPNQVKEEEATIFVKLVFGEDIRCAQLPPHCSIQKLIETVKNRHPSLKAFLIKYKDREDANQVQEPLRVGVENELKAQKLEINKNNVFENGNMVFQRMVKTQRMGHYKLTTGSSNLLGVFKNHVGFNSDAYLDLHEHGMKLYSDGMEDTVTCEEADDLFDITAEKFQEMAALALFN